MDEQVKKEIERLCQEQILWDKKRVAVLVKGMYRLQSKKNKTKEETVEYLTKQEAEERLRFEPEDGRFCPDCLTRLKEVSDDAGSRVFCPNEMCLNDEWEEI